MIDGYTANLVASHVMDNFQLQKPLMLIAQVYGAKSKLREHGTYRSVRHGALTRRRTATPLKTDVYADMRWW